VVDAHRVAEQVAGGQVDDAGQVQPTLRHRTLGIGLRCQERDRPVRVATNEPAGAGWAMMPRCGPATRGFAIFGHVGDGVHRAGRLPGANPAGRHGRGHHPQLAAAVSRAGGLGMLEHAGLIPQADRIAQLEQAQAGSFGVNFLMPFLDPGNPTDVELAAGRARLVG
jgi:hypothetical protein